MRLMTTSQTGQRTARKTVWCVLFMALSMMLGTILTPQSAAAQSRSLRLPPVVLPDVESEPSPADAASDTVQTATLPRPVIIDTDPGVDDAAALIWLFSQRRHPVTVQGIVTVAGNTGVTDGARNAQALLQWVGYPSIPVVMGAAAPLVQTLSSTGKLIHGPDGLWFTASAVPTPAAGPDGAPNFYCNAAANTPGLLVIALGPLTNLANALTQCPGNWVDDEIVALGGAKFGGNQTPVAEYNIWQDPEAAQIVVSQMNPANFSLVTFDAFQQFTVAPNQVQPLQSSGNQAIRNLLPALNAYAASFSPTGEFTGPVILPDPAAMIYALDRSLGRGEAARVEVIPGPAVPAQIGQVPSAAELVRGQTIIGLDATFSEPIAMNAGDIELSSLVDAFIESWFAFDLPGALFGIYARVWPNANFVGDIDAKRMQTLFLTDLRRRGPNVSSSSVDGASGDATSAQSELFLPLLQ